MIRLEALDRAEAVRYLGDALVHSCFINLQMSHIQRFFCITAACHTGDDKNGKKSGK